jgi:hypothetical protein
MSTTIEMNGAPVVLSIGILAWNEEESIAVALETLFDQSVFQELAARNERAQILVLANGCSDRTVPIVSGIFDTQMKRHPFRQALDCRVYDIQERGRNHSWNLFVHEYSSRDARCLYLMDGDIVLRHPQTIWNLFRAVETNPHASVAVDTAIKDISLKTRLTWRERLSLATSRMNASGGYALMTGQLYCIRASVARNIFLPKDLTACEDGLIRALACTQFLSRPLDPGRIIQAKDASHIFEAYTSAGDVLKNQKRQIIGQTIVHILVDQYLKKLPLEKRSRFAETMRENEAADPGWLKRLIHEHQRRVKFFWRLFPGLASYRFQRLSRMQGLDRVRAWPAGMIGFGVTLNAAFMAWRALKKGSTDYWPLTRSNNLRQLKNTEALSPHHLENQKSQIE